MIPTLRDYQLTAVTLSVESLLRQSGFSLLLSPGLGKTGVTCRVIAVLNAIDNLTRVLVTAPSRVMHHWLHESTAWQSGLSVRILDGSPVQRLKLLNSRFDGIVVVSHDLLHWLTQQKTPPFQLFVWDESSKAKNWSAKRTKAGRRIASTAGKRMVLTGSPMPNCPSEFFPQQFMLDRGKTLGTTVGKFRERFMHRGGFENREWIFDAQQLLPFQELIAPWVLRQDSSLLTGFPDIIYTDIKIDLEPAAKAIYKEIETELYTELTDNPLFAMSGASRYSLCRQIASGSYYDEHQVTQNVHHEKLQVLSDRIDEIDGPVLVAYHFRHSLEQIRTIYPSAPAINGDTSAKETQAIIARWQTGAIPVLLAQCQAISHGIDGLQFSSNRIIWYEPTDMPEVHEQLNARLARSGQTKTVFVDYLIVRGTTEVAILNVLRKKQTVQQALLAYFKENAPF